MKSAALGAMLLASAPFCVSAFAHAWASAPPGPVGLVSSPLTFANRVSRHHSLRVRPRSLAAASSCANSSSLTFVPRVLVRSGGFTTQHR